MYGKAGVEGWINYPESTQRAHTSTKAAIVAVPNIG